MQILRNSRGQGLVEYLIVVSLMAVAALGVMRILSQNTRAQFANVANAIQGKESKARIDKVQESYYSNRDLSDFFNGAAKSEK